VVGAHAERGEFASLDQAIDGTLCTRNNSATSSAVMTWAVKSGRVPYPNLTPIKKGQSRAPSFQAKGGAGAGGRGMAEIGRGALQELYPPIAFTRAIHDPISKVP
jgi:hypothetical protein